MATIKIEHLTFQYQSPKSILNDVSIEFPQAKFSLLVGPSGSGKSTLLKILTGLLPEFGGTIQNGTMSIFGQPLADALKTLQLALMFQNPNQQFTMDTPKNELIFALENLQTDPAQMDEKIDHALAFCEIEQLKDRQLLSLSGGEKQKVALALIVAMDCPVILLDEPFASVDPVARESLLQKLAILRDQYQKTIIIADHDLHGYDAYIDHVYQLDGTAAKITQLSSSQSNTLFQHFAQSQQDIQLSLPDLDNEQIALKLTNFSLMRQDQQLLSAENFAFFKNKITLITGANGIGKSTLFYALTKLMPYQGTILLNGDQNIHQIRAKQYARQVGLIFQDAQDQFLKITVQEELDLSMQQLHSSFFTTTSLATILDQLELTQHLDQVVYSLSEGQKKKLQILLMLISGQPILLLDEPLKGLDLESVQIILQLILQVRKATEQTIILISHQLTGLAGFIDYHVVFENQQLRYQESLS